MKALPPDSGAYERFLVRLDEFPVGALLRIAVGYAVVALWQVFADAGACGWQLVPWFLGVLVMLRVLPAVLRKLLTFPARAQAVWAHRRQLAKRFDSYQWRKLVWVGIGMAAYIASFRHFDFWVVTFSATALVAGLLGEWKWRSI